MTFCQNSDPHQEEIEKLERLPLVLRAYANNINSTGRIPDSGVVDSLLLAADDIEKLRKNQKEEELLPCPFCADQHPQVVSVDHCKKVECDNCGASSLACSSGDHIKYWNTRVKS